MSKDKTIELKIGEDGVYSPSVKEIKTKAVTKYTKQSQEQKKPKYGLSKDVDEFLAGLDVGLDLVDGIKVRAMRIMGLRD